MENKFLPLLVFNYRSVSPAAVNYRWLSAALKFGSWQCINCDFTRFGRKIKI